MRRAKTCSSRDPGNRGGDYEVGFCKAPVQNRFQPGESGNRKGRPRKTKNIKRDNSIVVFADAAELFDEKLQTNEPGRKKGFTIRRGAVRRYVQIAIKSDDPKVLGDLVKFIEKVDRAIFEGSGGKPLKIIIEGGLPEILESRDSVERPADPA